MRWCWCDGNPGDDFTERLEERVRQVRTSAKWRLEYMKMELKLYEMRMAGREEGRDLLSARLWRQLSDAAAADGGMGRRSGYILGCDPDINTSYRKYKKE